MNSFEIKLEVLADTLDKKQDILQQILTITENQESILIAEKDAPEAELASLSSMFLQMNDEKQKLIDKLLSSDTFFENVFREISDDFEARAEAHKPIIGKMQASIRRVTDLDVKIRLQEQRNRDVMQFEKPAKTADFTKASRSYMIKQYEKNNEREE